MGLILGGRLLRFIVDLLGSDVTLEIKDLAELIGAFDEYGVAFFNGAFGPDSAIAGLASRLVQAGNGTLEALNALNGVLWLAGSALTLIKAFAEGPGTLIVTAIGIFVGGMLQLGVAAGYQLINMSIDDENAADKVGGETAPEWCADNPRSCDWNGKS